VYVLVTFESEGSRNIHIIYEHFQISSGMHIIHFPDIWFNPLSPKLNPICYLLALLAHDFVHVSRIRVKSLTLR
jgi:transposase